MLDHKRNLYKKKFLIIQKDVICNKIRVDANNRKDKERKGNFKTHLYVIHEPKGNRKYFEPNKNKTYQNLWGTANTLLRKCYSIKYLS